MQILFSSDPHADGSAPMLEHLTKVINEAMHRFGERITRVEAHLSDADGHARTGAGAIHCTLEARLVGLAPLVVKDHADNAHQAIDGAVRKLKRAVGSELAKHDPRQQRTRSDAVPDADAASVTTPP